MTVMMFDPEFINTSLVWTGKSLGVYLFFGGAGDMLTCVPWNTIENLNDMICIFMMSNSP